MVLGWRGVRFHQTERPRTACVLIAGLLLVLLIPTSPLAAEVPGETTFLGTTNGWSGRQAAAVSPDGTVVALTVDLGYSQLTRPDMSWDGSTVVAGTGGVTDPASHEVAVFENGETTLLTSGANGESSGPLISDDGHTILFWSTADNLTAGDVNGRADLFLLDRTTGTTTNITSQTAGSIRGYDLSGDATTVVFTATNEFNLSFIHVWQNGATSYLTGAGSSGARITDDASKVVYLTAGDVMLLDRMTGRTEMIASDANTAVISGDGTVVAYGTESGPPGATSATTTRVGSDGTTLIPGGVPITISADGDVITLRGPQYFKPFIGSDFHDHFVWHSTLFTGTMDEAETLDQLIAATDYQPAYSDVLRLYWAFFNREPDIAGAKYWIDLNSHGHTLDQIAGYFTLSEEFANNYDGTTDRQYLEAVYSNVLGRGYDQSGFDYWLELLETNQLNRGGVVRWIAASSEFINKHPYPAT